MMGAASWFSWIIAHFNTVLVTVTGNDGGIDIHRMMLYLEFGEPPAVKFNKKLVVQFHIKLLEKPAERAFAGHAFGPAKHLTDYFVMPEQSCVG